MDPPLSPSNRPSRKGKDREMAPRDGPQPTDLDDRLTALRRKQAGPMRSKDKSEREQRELHRPLLQPPPPPPHPLHTPTPRTDRSPKPSATPARAAVPQIQRRHPSPQVIVSKPTGEADHESFSRLRITSSPTPRPAHSKAKLYNPDTDPISPRRTAEPESMNDAESANIPRNVHHGRGDGSSAARQLFDHRRHDPVHFHVLSRNNNNSSSSHTTSSVRPPPASKASGDYISAGSTSSYAASISGSSFTLSTDGSSTSSALFDNRPGHAATDDSTTTAFSQQLKLIYRRITTLESKIQQEESEDQDEMDTRLMLRGKEISREDLEKEKWMKKVDDHKSLAEDMYNLLQLSLAPSVPASLKNVPTKYNIVVRLWTHAFHKLLESLRRASFTSRLALELLQEFIYYAYTFYISLVEDPQLVTFRSGWLEALGDLARYRMIVAAMLDGRMGGNGGLTVSALQAVNDLNKANGLEVPVGTANGNSSGKKSVSDFMANRPASQPPSVGVAAARLLEVEPDKERWRSIARDWYATSLFEQPGTGKLHHHLGLLYREVDNEELRSMYHYVKSMTTLHPFMTSRESILPLWSGPLQARRMNADAKVSELFVLLHGMLFTNIQLDDFQPTLARFLERLAIEGAEEREWIMMAIINIASVLEYGKPSGLLRRMGGVGGREANGRVIAKKTATSEENKMDVDDEHGHGHIPQTSPTLSEADSYMPEDPPAFTYALQLTFAILSFVLRNPTRKATEFSRSSLNPYLTVLLTFLATILKHRPSLSLLERSIPWDDLAAFFVSIPRKVMDSQGLFTHINVPSDQRWVMLTSGCAPPLPEDWCMRGMEWVSRKVFERGYWKSGADRPEIEVLESQESTQVTDGQIEDDDETHKVSLKETTVKRWARIVRSAVDIAGAVPGFTWVEGTREWRVEGKLAEKVAAWREMERMEREEEEKRRMGKRWVDDDELMDVDANEVEEESSEDDENDSEEVKELKARRRYLRNLLQPAQANVSQAPSSRKPRSSKKGQDNFPELNIVAGYSVLVLDTNILLSSLSMVTSLVESLRWTIVIPLPVIMELDGLVNNPSQLGQAAQAAIGYITSNIRTFSSSLKVLTSKGNYLTTLSVRIENVDFNSGNIERSMDDLILKAAIWQDEHWTDRSAILGIDGQNTNGAVKVVLLSLDRNLRLKARSRQLPAAGEKDLAALLANHT
ncbi:Telomerase-binding protein EST1A [Leucoagaricus sp. SymC.cos]|nr:Telomerase-binding protein EST1A [Leucoagaricus sp. SymC.cos]